MRLVRTTSAPHTSSVITNPRVIAIRRSEYQHILINACVTTWLLTASSQASARRVASRQRGEESQGIAWLGGQVDASGPATGGPRTGTSLSAGRNRSRVASQATSQDISPNRRTFGESSKVALEDSGKVVGS
jgi:hypothetical protein